ncbi:MAG: deoxyribose-phosphate aldolase [Rhizobiaceae bacterium]|nr:deoxyribose-phosphate aldolase [Rhizobiaceae bacterium]
MNERKETALQALKLLDLTNLNDDCSEADIEALCARANGAHGKTAAVCIWPRFVAQAKTLLEGTGIRVATVVNFPGGGTDTDAVIEETKEALASGADEIDLVFPYTAFLAGDHETASGQIEAIKALIKPPCLLKIILETGKLIHEPLIKNASKLAIEAGANFIKTSTGKVSVNATPQTARIMLRAIKASGKPVGFKPAGGMKTTEDTGEYLALADEILGPNWASPATLRFGASGVLTDLIAAIEGKSAAPVKGY